MKIAIIDADLIGRKNHRFPNLVCEKISSYWKEKGAEVSLLLSYDDIAAYEERQITLFDKPKKINKKIYKKIYICKVFTDTPVPQWIDDLKLLPPDADRTIVIGGTGFYFDQAPDLPYEIEHRMPDYHLYDEWISNEIEKAKRICMENGKDFNLRRFMSQFKEYTDYSIGFLTRGCFRKCGFCVNKKYNRVFEHSPLEEFYDESRDKICLLDDNFLGCPQWKPMLEELIKSGKKFKFKQGLDERILTEEKCKMLFSANYDGDYTFAFDNIEDYELIHKKLKLIHKYHKKHSVKFYILVGYKSTDAVDIENCFKRIELLFRYNCLPYIMRYQNKNDTPWKDSKYRSLYITIARWANQPSLVKKMSLRQFCVADQALRVNQKKLCVALKSITDFEREYPKIAKKYFDMRYEDMKPED